MLAVQAALDAVVAEVKPLVAVTMDLGDALGLNTAQEVVSDVDSPPFDKALMDGFAVRSADLAAGEVRLTIVETITAGMTPCQPVLPGCVARIMTGAPLPDGADAVVKIEDVRIEGDRVLIRDGSVEPGQHVARRGASLSRGQRVLPAGTVLRPQELGALAEVGAERLLVYPRPKVAVLATGDELVPIGKLPGPGQIRNSNETMLAAQVRRAGGIPLLLGIARDNRAELRERILAGKGADILLLSGGVSEGTHDLVPAELAALGVRNVFHKVNVRPGKPLWFGVWSGSAERARKDAAQVTYVFGLPGNPVSSLVTFELFVRPCVCRLRGIEPGARKPVRATLVRTHVARGPRPTYNPARLEWTLDGPTVELVAWHGSSDLQAIVNANALAPFPGGDATYEAGSAVDVIPFDP